jgi:hypothetical protein
MPFKSEKQRSYLWKYHPDIAKKWEALTSKKKKFPISKKVKLRVKIK